ncbi:copia protein [Tanacetum coccineum]
MGLPRLLLDKREVMWPLSWPWKGLSSWVSCYKVSRRSLCKCLAHVIINGKNRCSRSQKDDFLILANDGLWDVVPNDVSCRLLQKMLGKEQYEDACRWSSFLKDLARIALSRGSKDNAVAMVVNLSLSEQSLSELPSSVQPESTRKTQPFRNKNFAHTATKEPPSHTKGEKDDMDTKEAPHQEFNSLIPSLKFLFLTDLGIDITPLEQPKSPPVSPKADRGKGKVIDDKVAIEEKLLAISKPELIKGVHKQASKVRIDPKILESAKGGQEFKKIQDAEIKSIEALIERNFQVHNPFKFGDFGLTKLEELGPTIKKKKNKIVSELMTSLGKRYERLKKITEELRIQSALLAPAPEQASSQLSRRKKRSWNWSLRSASMD